MAYTPKISGFFLIRAEIGLTHLVFTQDLRKRMSEWQQASPSELTVVGAVTTIESACTLKRWLSITNHGAKNGLVLHISATPRQAGMKLRELYWPLLARNNWFALHEETIKYLPYVCDAYNL